MLRLCPVHGRSASLGVNGGVGWTPGFCVMIGGSVERLHLLLIDFVLVKVTDAEAIRAQSHRGFCKSSRKTNCCNLFLGICLAKLLANFHHTFHNYPPHSLFQFNLIPTFPSVIQ